MAVDVATAAFVKQMAEARGKPLHESTPEEARALGPAMAATYGPAPEMARVEEHSIPVSDGEITLRVLVPIEPPRGVLVYYHGGGWVIGSIDEYDTMARKLAERTSCAIVLVEYRLAPEHRYPTAVDDSYAALEWAGEHVQEIAGSEVPLIIAGDSAGGNLAAVMALRARDRGGPRMALQVLIYPATDTNFDRPSYMDPENQLLLTRDGVIWFWDHYLPDVSRRSEPDASPLHAPDLAGLPPAVVLTAEHDPLRDEGEAYAERLSEAGVEVNFKRHLGQMHAFFSLLMLPGGERGFQQVVKAVRACIMREAKT
ncbi:MAG TPA: alpha/beta hydrolase [Dehalococcoidia bacterium]|nr:alpha/beta hydrolase [Dehalococcoidia bacterium]